MNFSQIKCFLAASECLSFTRAADRLYLSQPVLSRQIAAMEDELGIELFTREKKSIRLTPAGEILAQGLNRLAREYQALVEKAGAVHRGFAGRLNIGMVEGQLICPPYSVALNKFHDKYPDVQVNLSRHTMAGIHSALQSGEIDVAFAALFNLNDQDDLDYIPVGMAGTRLVIPKSHPLADKENVSLTDFREDTFLTLPETESPYIARFSERIAKHDFFRPRTLEAPNIGALALWLEAGYGIFPLNANHSLRNNPNLVFKYIPELEDAVEIVMWKKDNTNPLIAMFTKQFEGIGQS
ncbi:DNA-binding transcriptional regulator, LysR family [Sporobacter termitidis DSM 10068]|uniref:DNA-binding transcriptional regulator, LysR family n=1 Tax=Sporobacter termitidis DSM 10068 TaxID=1123282 RepID=A0A1M5YP91_9FIRM|nr:LysR family transcriptional regulator [Sporobacter termitidis]SHI13393.1 DNA-binding transcriptional regulator, LysR family [Sporobacter termitidis DSM 10068]